MLPLVCTCRKGLSLCQTSRNSSNDIAIDICSKLGNGIQTDIAFERRGDPRAYAVLTGSGDPLTTTLHTSVQRGLEDDITGLDDVQHVPLHLWVVDADEFFIERYRQG